MESGYNRVDEDFRIDTVKGGVAYVPNFDKNTGCSII